MSCYAQVSNEDGSHLSSVGRALISERYEGSYGCPVLSRRNMSRLDAIIKNESRVVLEVFV